jgi:hypothetical protein
MRRLRFPEIQELIHRDAAEHKGTAYYADRMNYGSSINHAYNDAVWEDAGMWAFYATSCRPLKVTSQMPDPRLQASRSSVGSIA